MDPDHELYTLCGPTREQGSLEELIKAIRASAQEPPGVRSLGIQGKPRASLQLFCQFQIMGKADRAFGIEAFFWFLFVYMIHLRQTMDLLAA